MSKNKVLVTGCAGFIGSHICERLISLGYKVMGIDAFTNYYSTELKRYNLTKLLGNDCFNLLEQDLSQVSVDYLSNIVRKVDYIIHEAAQPGVRYSWGSSFTSYVTHNIIATQNLLEATVKANNIKRLVYASSSSVYGNQLKIPLREDMYPKPYSPYGVTKLTAELLCLTYFENHNIPVVNLRYFTVYGPRQRPDMAFHKFIKNMFNNQPIEIYGDGTQMRDFTYVDDVVDATIKAMESNDAVGETINIGSSNPVKLNDVIKLLGDIIGTEPRILYKKRQMGDVNVTFADIRKAKDILYWTPKTSLKNGLERQVEWMREIFELGLL